MMVVKDAPADQKVGAALDHFRKFYDLIGEETLLKFLHEAKSKPTLLQVPEKFKAANGREFTAADETNFEPLWKKEGLKADARRLALQASVMPATDVLIDASGGRGEPIDVSRARIYVAAMCEYAPNLGIGVAGGFSAEELSKNPALVSLVREYKLHVDAEGQLRDGDEGGTLNVARAQAWVRAASVL
jgi:hypothetical protein